MAHSLESRHRPGSSGLSLGLKTWLAVGWEDGAKGCECALLVEKADRVKESKAKHCDVPRAEGIGVCLEKVEKAP